MLVLIASIRSQSRLSKHPCSNICLWNNGLPERLPTKEDCIRTHNRFSVDMAAATFRIQLQRAQARGTSGEFDRLHVARIAERRQ